MVGLILNASRIRTEDPNVSRKWRTLENIFDKELKEAVWAKHSFLVGKPFQKRCH